uniref:Uncharacterized protein n=1 Tax=viral metagenome TaxID=1070528 RepID=A0A6M3L9T6_9ZZZZ
MNYKIKVWIPVEVEPSEDTIFDDLDRALDDAKECRFLQPYNIYKVVECDEKGEETGREIT